MTVLGKAQRFLLNDEERGKKDDDHKPSTLNRGLRNPGWYPNRVPQRRSLKRVAVVIVVAALVFLFIYNIPTDLGPVRTARPNYGAGTRKPAGSYATSSSAAAENNGSPVATYTGPPKFLELASSLHAIAGTRGGMLINKNVLFATSSLKSAAILLPIACQMGRETRNYVHFALMSRSEIDIEELRSINGIDESCQIIFHDARAEKAAIMSDDRMEYAVFRAFHHIFMWMHPQAIIIDGSGWEEYFLTKAATTHVKATGNTLIELPYAVHDLLWLTKLDSRSLRAWNQNHVDILIQAVPGTTGSLIRLLRSLSAADFLSNSIPHLTIELPTDVDAATKSFLAGFQWPPSHVSDAAGANYLSLRHRIPRQRLAEEEASTRFLESFWPVDPKTSHVLVLSPQVELTPNFFHYLKYTLLEYRYSEASHIQHWDARLLGISLEQPLQLLSGDQDFTPPLSKKKDSGQDIASSFLWQAPASHAMLFMGEKWIELHDLVSRSLDAQQTSDSVPSSFSKKVVSPDHPSWLEHALRLSRLRGYWALYPGQETAKNLGIVHTELFRAPEEYVQERIPVQLSEESSDEEIEQAMTKLKAGSESRPVGESSLQNLLDAGSLRPFGNLPLVMWNGTKTDLVGLDESVAEYAVAFKTQVGKCTAEILDTKRVEMSTRDLFCT